MNTLRLSALVLAAWLYPALAAAQTALSNGTYQTVSGSQGQTTSYYLSIPAGYSSIAFQTSGGTGNVDIAVNLENSGPAECTSAGPNNEEYCEIANPAPGNWYVNLTGATDYQVDVLGIAATELLDGVPLTISGFEFESTWYYIDVPSGQSRLTVSMSGGSGDPDLIIGTDLFGAPECYSDNVGPSDSCPVANPAPTRWYVLIFGYTSYAYVTLRADFSTGGGGGALSPLSLAGLLVAGLLGVRRRRFRGRPTPAP